MLVVIVCVRGVAYCTFLGLDSGLKAPVSDLDEDRLRIPLVPFEDGAKTSVALTSVMKLALSIDLVSAVDMLQVVYAVIGLEETEDLGEYEGYVNFGHCDASF